MLPFSMTESTLVAAHNASTTAASAAASSSKVTEKERWLEMESSNSIHSSPTFCRRRTCSTDSSSSTSVSEENVVISSIPEQQQQRSVSFQPYVEFYDIDTLEEYSEYEIDACWYKEDEIAAIRRDNQATARRIIRNCRRTGDYPRGLESQLPSFYASSRRVRDRSVAEVFREQYKQRQMNILDSDRIQQVYMAVSYQCLTRSIESARLDAWEAYRIHQESCTIPEQNDIYNTNEDSITDKKKICWLLDISCLFPQVVKSPITDMEE